MNPLPFCRFLCLLPLLTFACARADLTLPGIFSDRMVLQREMPVAVFGSGIPGRTVRVSLLDAEGAVLQGKASPVGGDLRWRLALDPMPAGGPFALRVSDGVVTNLYQDVLVGEVWLMSGQSNMANPIGKEDYATRVEGDDYPRIRAFNQRMGWMPAEPFNIQFMYAQAYFFARAAYLAEGQKVPMGFYSAAYVNSAIHEWMDPLSLAADPESAAKEGAGRHFNNLVRPVLGYTFRGMIWDQGENNGGLEADSTRYGEWLRRLITHWRVLSQNPRLLVIVPQLPILRDEWRNPQSGPVATGGSDRASRIRQGQFEAMALPGVNLVPTWDISDGDIHPRNAHQKAERAARIYQSLVMRRGDIGYQGPTFLRQEIKKDSLVLHFLHAGTGLALDPTVAATLQADANPAKDLLGMAIAGEDGVFHWAKGVIGKQTVTLSSPSVPKPTQARYVWADDLRQAGNLVNSAGLPTPCFRSDPSVPVFEPGKPIPELPPLPGPVAVANGVYEGELADLISTRQGGMLDFKLALSGGAYLSTNGKVFATEWNQVYVREPGPHHLVIRYRSKGSTVILRVNGEDLRTDLDLPDTNGAFQAVSLPDVTLLERRFNRIKLLSAPGNANGVDIDAISINNVGAFTSIR